MPFQELKLGVEKPILRCICSNNEILEKTLDMLCQCHVGCSPPFSEEVWADIHMITE